MSTSEKELAIQEIIAAMMRECDARQVLAEEAFDRLPTHEFWERGYRAEHQDDVLLWAGSLLRRSRQNGFGEVLRQRDHRRPLCKLARRELKLACIEREWVTGKWKWNRQ